MSEPLRRADDPPEKGPRDWIIRVRPGSGFVGQCISPSIWGVFTHWDGDRTRECLADEKKCQRCIDGQPNRFRAYLYVWDSLAKDYGFLELTGDAVEELWRQAGGKNCLRGLILEVKRRGAGVRGTLIVKASPPAGDPDKLPANKDPEETLRRLWSWVKYR